MRVKVAREQEAIMKNILVQLQICAECALQDAAQIVFFVSIPQSIIL